MRTLVVVWSELEHDSRVARHISSLAGDESVEIGLFSFSSEDIDPDEIKSANPVFVTKSLSWSDSIARTLALTAIISSIFLIASGLSSVYFDIPWVAPLLAIFSSGTLYVLYRLAVRQLNQGQEKPNFGRFLVPLVIVLFRRSAQKGLRNALDQFKPDIVHVHDFYSLLALSRGASPGTGPKIVWDAHELYHHQQGVSPFRRFFVRQTIARVLPLVDHIFTVSEGVRNQYNLDFKNLPPCTIVANATSASPVSARSRVLRDRIGVDENRRVLLFQGGIGAGRGVPLLLELVPHLDNRWVLVFMGRGLMEEEIKKAAISNPDRIFLLPPVPLDELVETSSGATLGAIPYESTNLNHINAAPNKIWEYSASGVPILTRDLPELARLVGANGIGMVFRDSDSPEEVAERLNLLTEADLAIMVENTRTFALVDNWEKYEQRMFSVYRSLLFIT